MKALAAKPTLWGVVSTRNARASVLEPEEIASLKEVHQWCCATSVRRKFMLSIYKRRKSGEESRAKANIEGGSLYRIASYCQWLATFC